MWLLLAFIAVPLIEIALFIKVGGWLTLWPTLAIVLGTAVLGTWLVKREGLKALEDVKRAMAEMRDPSAPLAHGGLILFSGALLLTPGFFTDTIGLLLLIPAVRKRVIAAIAARVQVRAAASRQGFRRGDDIIEGEAVEVPQPEIHTDASRSGSTRKPSGWTEH